MDTQSQTSVPDKIYWPSLRKRVIALDIEVTGSGESGRIIQVGMMSNAFPESINQVISFDAATEPGYMERKCREKNITREDQDRAVTFSVYAPSLSKDLDGATIVTYNGGNDLLHLSREFVRASSSISEINMPNRCMPTYGSIIDVKNLATQLIPRDKIKGYSLWDVSKYFGILEEGHEVDRHNAELDAVYTYKILVMMMNMAPTMSAFEGLVTTAHTKVLPGWAVKAFSKNVPPVETILSDEELIKAAEEAEAMAEEAEDFADVLSVMGKGLNDPHLIENMMHRSAEQKEIVKEKRLDANDKRMQVRVPYLEKYSKAARDSPWSISLVQIYAASKHQISYREAGHLPNSHTDWKSAARVVRGYALGEEEEYFAYGTNVQSLEFVVDYFMFEEKRMRSAKHFFENNWNKSFLNSVGHVGPDPLTTKHRMKLASLEQRKAHPIRLTEKHRRSPSEDNDYPITRAKRIYAINPSLYH
jgi:DNA polymerase III epsilon subunit-like protein